MCTHDFSIFVILSGRVVASKSMHCWMWRVGVTMCLYHCCNNVCNWGRYIGMAQNVFGWIPS